MLEGYNNSNKNATSHQNEYSSFFIGCMDKKGWSIKNEQQIESQSKANKEKFLIANEYFMSRNWSSLIRFSNDWISIEPSNPSPYEWRALAKANLKDKSAIDDFRSNIFLSDQPTARQYKNLGLAYKNFDDEDMAKYQFKKCLKIDPNDNFCKDSLTSLNDKRISNNLSHSEGKPIFGSYKWEKNTSSLTVKVLQIDFYHDGVKIISEIKKGNDINHTESYGKVSWESKEEFHPTPDQIYYRYIIKPLKDNDIKTSNRKFSKIQIYVWAQKDIDKRGDIFMIEGNQLNNKIIPILSAGQLDL
jgi:tetratricopeptide (TPR) repeat protein